MSIDEAMMTAPVLQALEIGIDGGSIRNATQRQLMACGRPYETVEDLIKAVFGDPEDAEPIANGQCTEGISASLAGDVSRLINMLDEAGVGSNCVENHNNASSSTTTMNPSNVQNQIYGNVMNGPSCSAAVTNALQTKNTGDNTEIAAKADKIDDACTNKVASEQTLNRTLSLEEENRKLKDARLCKVCLDEEVGVVFLPCGHLGAYAAFSYSQALLIVIILLFFHLQLHACNAHPALASVPCVVPILKVLYALTYRK